MRNPAREKWVEMRRDAGLEVDPAKHSDDLTQMYSDTNIAYIGGYYHGLAGHPSMGICRFPEETEEYTAAWELGYKDGQGDRDERGSDD